MTLPDGNEFQRQPARVTMSSMAADVPKVEIRLWRSDAIVLFDWLMSTNLDSVPITHPAQKQALADLTSHLEQSDVSDVTQQEIDRAQAEVCRDMGW